MVPLKDDNPTDITPYVTYILIVINIIVFIYEISLSSPELEALFATYGVVPQELTRSFQSGQSDAMLGQLLTLITCQFLHGGFLHLGGNMLFLWIFGNNIEDKLGHLKYIIFYLSCGIFAALAQYIFAINSTVPTIGASGAIAGVMGAYIIRFPKAKILTLIPLGFFITTFRIPAVFFLGFWFAQQALYGVASLEPTTQADMGGVAYWAHAGGFAFGALLGGLMGLFNRDNR
ncbi:MAG: rhomboid family intramembrane serine protease [Jaaginema sp. PMC 1079.18]|nr:rhomboid family intramembrane serine protease [Jaaginema sp. PMC 1080.18]MEC4853091.1 rhomboid family intramembrane serine protease [Jaaginema sp. PMC 1079.18]MEC4868487.1 rhomboid family intramembrane serine protease [Jaaginema sp. PMC 1078.18]